MQEQLQSACACQESCKVLGMCEALCPVCKCVQGPQELSFIAQWSKRNSTALCSSLKVRKRFLPQACSSGMCRSSHPTSRLAALPAADSSTVLSHLPRPVALCAWVTAAGWSAEATDHCGLFLHTVMGNSPSSPPGNHHQRSHPRDHLLHHCCRLHYQGGRCPKQTQNCYYNRGR